MTNGIANAMLLVASQKELPADRRVWGTGGWLSPEQREGLDWLTLARLLGWEVSVARLTPGGLEWGTSEGERWLVVACDPENLQEEIVAHLRYRLARQPILVVARADLRNGIFARLAGAARTPEQVSGRSLRWTGPGGQQAWHCRRAFTASALEVSEGTWTWATLDGAPVIVARAVGNGVLATLAFHPSEARDLDGAATAMLKQLLIWGSAGPVAWFETEGSLILRMDDPGGAQNVYSRSWCYPKLGESQWADIGTDLAQRAARLSIGYVSGWVDDGDPERGILKVEGNSPRRIPGRVYPSPLVKYHDRAGHAPGRLYDGEAEYRGIQSLRTAGLADVELHGYTHIHPDTATWAKAPDRFETWPVTSWYRELGIAAEATILSKPLDEHPIALGKRAFQRFFHSHPTTLIAPGDQWTEDALKRALDLGFSIVSSYYLALRDGDRFAWSQHVCAPYLDRPDPAWFDSGLPVVGYFHDFEISTYGVGWMRRWLDQWQFAGARRLLDFRELAGALCRRLSLENHNGGLHLRVSGERAPAMVRPIPVLIRIAEGALPLHLLVSLDNRQISVDVDPLGADTGRLMLPKELDAAASA